MRKILWTVFHSGKKLLLWSIYSIFAGYIIYLAATSPKLESKLFFSVVGIAALAVTLLFEYLKRSYEKMICALTFDCDIIKAEQLKKQLYKADLFKGFTGSLRIFDALLLMDKGHYNECLEHLAKNEKFFRSTFDYLFIYYHTQLHCFYFLEEFEKADTALESLTKLKQLKTKQISPLYSWSEIEGIKYYVQGRNKKSLEAFEQVDTSRLNNRELAYLYYMQGRSTVKSGAVSDGNRLLKEARTLGNTLHLTTI
ncbi:hypothetical protein [Enterococcus sp. LJL51]|uniref:hypothetical protein n=1 Tax=Enterococcus sp. LJL51 TaxID=3416656 RepID=UPI003CF02008